MRIAVVAAFCLLTGACSASPFRYMCAHPEFTDDDYQRAALDAVGLINTDATSERDVARVDQEVARLRPWAQKITDPCMRDHVSDWLDYFARNARESLQNVRDTGSNTSKYDRELEEERHRSRELLSRSQLPPKPNEATAVPSFYPHD